MASLGRISTSRDRVLVGIPVGLFAGKTISWSSSNGSAVRVVPSSDGRSAYLLAQVTSAADATVSYWDAAAPAATTTITLKLRRV